MLKFQAFQGFYANRENHEYDTVRKLQNQDFAVGKGTTQFSLLVTNGKLADVKKNAGKKVTVK